MNVLRRIVQWFVRAWAVLRGVEAGTVRPLPAPVVDPTVTLAQLVAEADARGGQDAQTMMYDHWSFGVEGDEESDERDPEYVRSLRRRCAAAVAALHDRNRLTTARLSHVYSSIEESNQLMAGARTRMGDLAAWEADRERLDLLNVMNRRHRAAPGGSEAVATATSRVWEGEARTLPWLVSLIVLGCLVAVEYPVQRYVFGYYLTGSAAEGLVVPLTVATSVFLILGPYLAGLMIRGRHASGGERRLTVVVALLALPWLYAVAVVGLLRGQILEAETGADGGSRSARLHVVPITVVVMFVALLLIAGLMSFLLGLARRHPFQEAYVRQRRRSERLQAMARHMADRLDPNYRGPAPVDGPADPAADPAGPATGLAAAEQVLRESYQAAEEAYFAALERTIGDPTFTEAVSRRRGLRRASASVAPPAVPA